MRAILFSIILILCLACGEKLESTEKKTFQIQGVWLNDGLHLIFKDTLIFDPTFGSVASFKIRNDTILVKEIDQTLFKPYYKISQAKGDSLKLIPLEYSPYSLDSNVESIIFSRSLTDLNSQTCNFSKLWLEGGYCPLNCPEFTVKLDSQGNYSFKGINNTDYLGLYQSKLSDKQIKFICSLINNLELNQEYSEYTSTSSEPEYILGISMNNKTYRFRINGVPNQIPKEIVDMITYLKNTPIFYRLQPATSPAFSDMPSEK